MAVTPSARVVCVGAGGSLGLPAADALVAGLEARGLPVSSRCLVTVDEAALEAALAPGPALTVIVADGGGAEGDALRRALARAAGTRLVLNERMLASLQERHRRVDRPVPRAAERQALLPQGAVVWEGGVAEPAWAVETGQGIFAVLPRGSALAPLIEECLMPFLQARLPLGGASARTLRTAGVTLAELEERLGDRLARGFVSEQGGEAAVVLVPAEGDVWVRIQARGPSPEAAASARAAAEAWLVETLGDDCYGRDADLLEEVVGRLLLERGLTLSVAESCTGGLVGDRLTNIAGSSAYFERGVVVYSNRAKQELLGVPEDILRAHGAVSAPCAEAMVRGLAERTGSPCGIAVTGIAGPDGGSAAKPVGTVFIGVAVAGEVEARRFRFLGDRRAVKWQSAQTALDLLRRRLLARGRRP